MNIQHYILSDLRRLCSAKSKQEIFSVTFGRYFVTISVAGPKAWNHHPADIRAIDTVSAFKTSLKTFLFR